MNSQELFDNRQELFDYINSKSNEVENTNSLEDLKDFKDIVLQLQDVLPDERKDAMSEVKNLRASIAESEAFIEEAQAKCDTLNREIATHTKDINACKEIVKRISEREDKIVFDSSVTKLMKKAQSFEDAVRTCIDTYYNSILESSFLISEAEDVDLSPAYEVARSFLNPPKFNQRDSNWVYAENTYNELILELCQLKVKGEYISVSKDRARFEVINNLIAQYEERLFKNVKS